MVLRIVIFVAILGLIFLGVRRIWRDLTGNMRQVEAEERAQRRARDLADRKRTDVVELRRDADGTYRPDDKSDRR